MRPEIEELKLRIVAQLDEMEFLDILGYTIVDLVEVLEDELENHHAQLSAAVR